MKFELDDPLEFCFRIIFLLELLYYVAFLCKQNMRHVYLQPHFFSLQLVVMVRVVNT